MPPPRPLPATPTWRGSDRQVLDWSCYKSARPAQQRLRNTLGRRPHGRREAAERRTMCGAWAAVPLPPAPPTHAVPEIALVSTKRLTLSERFDLVSPTGFEPVLPP